MNIKRIEELLHNVKFGECKVEEVVHLGSTEKHHTFSIAMDRQVFPHGGNKVKYRIEKDSLILSYYRGFSWYRDEHISNLEKVQ